MRVSLIRKHFGDELELAELESFFRECDLYPSNTELEDGIDVIFQGKYNILIYKTYADICFFFFFFCHGLSVQKGKQKKSHVWASGIQGNCFAIK